MSVAILLLDDHAGIRRHVRELLVEVVGDAIFGEAATVSQALELIRGVHWDIAIVDLKLPDGSGLALVHELATSQPGVMILVLTALPREAYEEAASSAGALAFIPKDDLETQLIGWIRRRGAGP